VQIWSAAGGGEAAGCSLVTAAPFIPARGPNRGGRVQPRDPDRLPGFLDRGVSGWTQVIESSLGDRPDADTLAALVFATMTGLEVLQLMQPGSARANQALEMLIDVFQRELRGKEPG